MTQRVCEKCGAVIEKPGRRNILAIDTYYTKIRLFKEDDEKALWTSVDLCNRCRCLFDEWIETPPKEETYGND